MTLRTLTFDPKLYKLAPIKPIPKMLIAAGTVRGYDGAAPDADHIAWWDEMLAAVPDTLPGVIEHSGEPVAFYDPENESRQDTFVFASDYPKGAGASNVALFTHPAPAQPVERQELSDAAADVLAERRRQMSAEGWTAEHDDEHADGSLAEAAIAYSMVACLEPAERAAIDSFGFSAVPARVKSAWPTSWCSTWFKPRSRRRDLVRAGALILAEIERLDRAADRGQA